ncbi:MAG TPA: hypothetical protein VNG13_01080, partial [Mycobacteriales bacterium]|nr:hypothetical protein [Mycobacteriales bacterium]
MGVVLATGDEDLLGGIERRLFDEWRVRSGVVAVSEVDLAEVGAVAQYREDRWHVPGPSGFGAVAAFGEPVADRPGAEVLLGVQVEDDPHQRRLV